MVGGPRQPTVEAGLEPCTAARSIVGATRKPGRRPAGNVDMPGANRRAGTAG